MKKFLPFWIIAALCLTIPSLAFAWCGNCGGDHSCCPCPGQAQCLYPHASCEEACGLSHGSSAGAAPAMPSVQNSFMQGLTNGFMQGISASMQPQEKTPQQIEAERQAEIRAEQERQAAAAALAEKKRKRIEGLDRRAFEQMSLLGLPFNQEKKPSSDFRSALACTPGEEEFVCHVTVCGGSTGNDICCPPGYPKLNECDCKCYPADAEFECMQYAGCNYSTPARTR